MTTREFWVDSSGGNDSNDGTSSGQAIQTIAALAFLGDGDPPGTLDGDVIYLNGTFRESLKIGGAGATGIGCRVTSWPGQAYWTLRGDTLTVLTDWTYAGTQDVFELALPAGTCHNKNNRTLPEGIATVVVDWDTIVDEDGYHSGHLTRAQSAADCATRVNSWWFTPTGTAGTNQDGSGTLRINIGKTDGTANGWASTTPFRASGLTIAYVVANENGVEIGTQRYKDKNYTQGDYATDNPYGTRGWTVENGNVYLFADGGFRSQFGSGGTGIDVGASTTYGTNSMGYGVRLSDGVNTTVKNITTIDCGYHGIMFVGDRCSGNTMVDCVMYGGSCNPLSGCSIGGAFYCGSSTSSDPADNKNIFGCLALRCTVYKYTHLGRTLESVFGLDYAVPIRFPFTSAGASTYTTCTCDGFICHTNAGAGQQIQDVEYRDCLVVERGKVSDNTMCLGSAYKGGGDGTSASNILNWRTYPVRVVDCEVRNAAYCITDQTADVAFVRCRISLDRHGVNGGVAAGTGALGSSSGTHTILFESCAILDTMGHASTSRLTFQCSLTNNIILLNTTAIGVGTDTNSKYLFNFLRGGTGINDPNQSYVYARGCILGFDTSAGGTVQLLTMGVTPDTTVLNQSNFDMNDCLYFGPSGFIPTGFPGPNSFSAWTSTWNSVGIDQGTVNNGTTTPVTSTSGTTFELTAAAKLLKRMVTPHAGFGINNRLYSGHFGAYQYGPVGVVARSRLRGRPIGGVR